MFRTLRTVMNPVSRTALIAFAWTHRRTIMRWGRSFWSELTRPGRIDPSRLSTISKVLWAITRDDELAKARQLRQIRLDGDELVIDASSRWRGRARLVDRLKSVEGIARIVDIDGRVIPGSIQTSAA
jgi:hypothetical protein